MAQLTPMMVQYTQIKEQHKDKILFYRLGDFYEMFFEDALVASKALEITLTARDCGMEERAPMCGVPYHSAEVYIAKLIEQNFKVAICEQVEDPALTKGIVRREVVKIITPGTVTNAVMLDEKRNNFILSVAIVNNEYAIGYSDLSTGEFSTTHFFTTEKQALLDEIHKLKPSEVICNMKTNLLDEHKIEYSLYEAHHCDMANCVKLIGQQFRVNTIYQLGINEVQAQAVGSLLQYLNETQKTAIGHIKQLHVYSISKFMKIDSNTRRNLELCETMMDKTKKGSLLSVLDRASTAMGSRRLRQWVESPLLDKVEINHRLDGVEELINNFLTREELKEYLKAIYDIERLSGRISLGSASARDLIAFKKSIGLIPHIKQLLKETKSKPLSRIVNELDELMDIYDLIEKAIVDDPPLSIKEGGIIKKGYDNKMDELKEASTNGRQWMLELEQKEKLATGIKNLKLGYNRVFGYYIDVTKSNISAVPDYFIRKQTLSNSERYITPKLKELENIVLGADEKLIAYENYVFTITVTAIAEHILRIQKTAGLIAELDVYCSFADVGQSHQYCRPIIVTTDEIEIKQSRHPVVEAFHNFNSFIPNDVNLDEKDNRMIIITGPNMSGKSTYMRQVALITLMAQIGCFVPAEFAQISIVDRIFTRVGASDDLASGRSTFMVEMSELANILSNATKKSLIILDEIGRGTSTFDGLSIAWAVVEYIVNKENIGAKTLFATHYHELTELEDKLNGVKNYSVSVLEQGDNIVFLRKIIRGGASGSYGIHVARLAGLPNTVLERASEIIKTLDKDEKQHQNILMNKKKKASSKTIDLENEINLFNFSNHSLESELEKIDINGTTPMEALQILMRLKEMTNKR